MSEHVYRITELAGSSTKGLQAAIENAVRRAGKTLRNLRWFEVSRISGHIDGGSVAHWQVVVKIGFTLED